MSTDVISPQRRVRDCLVAEMGLLRVMYRSEGQVDMCPPLKVIEQDIIQKWKFDDPQERLALRELLRSTQPAAGHDVSDYRTLCRVLRRHQHQQSLTAQQELLLRQQRLQKAPTRPKESLSEPPVAAAPTATSPTSVWVNWLKRFSTHAPGGVPHLTWPQFWSAVSPAVQGNPGMMDGWHARQHFLSCSNAQSTSTACRTAPIATLACVFSAATPINIATTSRVSKSMREALAWKSATEAIAPVAEGVGATPTAAGASPRKHSGFATRALELRTAATVAFKQRELEADAWKQRHPLRFVSAVQPHLTERRASADHIPKPPAPTASSKVRPQTAR